MTHQTLPTGSIVSDRKGHWYKVVGQTSIYGIPAVRITRIRKDGGCPSCRLLDKDESVNFLTLVSLPGKPLIEIL